MLPFPSLDPRPAADDAAAGAVDLAARVRARDPDAESELVSRYRPGLMMMLRRLLKDPSLADDYCQEVFRVAFEALRHNRIDDGARLAAYLWSVARNLANSDLRRHYRNPAMTALSEAMVDNQAAPEQAVLREERNRLLHDALTALTRRDRAVLTAFYLEDTAKESICRRMGLSASQFDVIKWRALKRLRALVRDREGR